MPAAQPILARAQQGALTPAGFAQKVNPAWRPARHLLVLNWYLLQVYSGAITNLMVFMPPRHGKTELVSRAFPAWYLGRRPWHRIMLASYEHDFAASHSGVARDYLSEHGGDMYGVIVDPSSRAMDRWGILDHGGGMFAAGVGGPVTGKGGQGLIIDDPVKNDEEANSVRMREKAWDWWRATWRTRATPDKAHGLRPWQIVVMTRWHQDDLGGRILQHSKPGTWTVLNMPAIAEALEALPVGWERQPGEPLWPEQFSVSDLADLKHDLGGYWWSALFQQRPAPAEGGIIKRPWFLYWHGEEVRQDVGLVLGLRNGTEERVRLSQCRRILTVDVAASTKQMADYTVVAAWAITPKRQLVLLDLLRVRMEGPDQPALVQQMHQRWRPQQIHVESVAYQLTLVQTLRRLGLPIVETNPDKDKVSRALVAAARIEGGDVFFPSYAEWLADYEAELVQFNTGAHDDQVDVTSMAAEVLTSQAGAAAASW